MEEGSDCLSEIGEGAPPLPSTGLDDGHHPPSVPR